MLKVSRVRRKNWWLVPAVVGVAATCTESIQAESPPPTADSVLRLARSRDGRRFTDTGVLFVNHAGAPNLVRLRNGDLLAVFDPLGDEGREEARVMAASSSSDEGRSWSPVRPIRVRTRTGKSMRVRHAALVQMPDRRCRMFFTTPPGHKLKRARRSARSRVVLAAVTKNGFDWQLDERVAVEFPVTPDQHPTAGWVGDELHLFFASPSGVDAGRTHHAMSHAGRRFTKPARVRVPHVRFVGSIVPMGRRARAYAFDDDGVRSLVSRNGRDWKLEPGIRITNAWDPAVIRLRDGSFLMLYCTWAQQGEAAAAQLADTSEYETGAGGYSGTTATADAGADVEIVDEPAGSELEDEHVAGDNAGYESDDTDESGEWRADAQAGWAPGGDFTGGSNEGDTVAVSSADVSDGDPDDDDWDSQPHQADLVLAESTGQSSGPPAGTDVGRSEKPQHQAEAADGDDNDWTYPDDRAADAPDVGESTPPGGSEEPSADGTGTRETDVDRPEYAAREGQRPNDTGNEPPISEDPRDGVAVADAQWQTAATDDWLDQDPLAFVPPPDFDKKIEYIEWYRTRGVEQTEDNAYEAYAEFMPGMRGSAEDQAEWPELHDMFNDREHQGEPAPWDPADHPEWESSNDQVQDLLEKFREATTHEGYATPADPPRNQMPDSLADQDLMIGILLPQLSSHRKLQRATLADAWRLRDGELSVERMLDAWRTALRGANHIARGATLIEELVAIAERVLVHKNARWALKRVTFSADQLTAALDVLIRYDGAYRDRTLALVGEHATSMDTLQWVFMPAKPGDPPRANIERAKLLFGWAMEPDTEFDAPLEALAEMGPDDVQAAIDASEAYYRELARLMRIGYPQARASDVQAIEAKYVHTNIWTELLFPSLSRVHVLRARDEASRRATQLAFAVHLHKAKHGSWPGSLDALPTAGTPGPDGRGATAGLPAGVEYDRFRTDPFTGKDFGYRVGPDGPTIYSLSENAKDDGGVHSPRWDDEITNDAGSDDYVFWPPQERQRR